MQAVDPLAEACFYLCLNVVNPEIPLHLNRCPCLKELLTHLSVSSVRVSVENFNYYIINPIYFQEFFLSDKKKNLRIM